MIRTAVALACFLVLAPAALAADGDVVEGTGEAQIQGGDVVAARKQATADALRKCIEKVVGISIQSEFTAEQREVVAGKQDQFYSAVRDNLVQQAEGFIDSHEVVSETQSGDVLRVTVRARVFESKIKARARELADLLKKAGNPKLMLVLQEVFVDAQGHRRVARESSVGAYLEQELLARGFELRGAKAAKDLADDSIAAYDRWLEDAGGAAELARANGADVLVAGRVEITDKGKIEDAGGLDALVGQTRIEIDSVVRGLNAATGEVLSTKPVRMVSVGTTSERALHRALVGRGKNVISQTFHQLVADLQGSFEKTAAEGQSYVVALKGITSFRKQGQGFVDALKAVDGMSSVRQKSFEGGVLVLDLRFKGSLGELQRKIFSAVERTEGFDTLDVDGISGKQLSLKM